MVSPHHAMTPMSRVASMVISYSCTKHGAEEAPVTVLSWCSTLRWTCLVVLPLVILPLPLIELIWWRIVVGRSTSARISRWRTRLQQLHDRYTFRHELAIDVKSSRIRSG